MNIQAVFSSSDRDATTLNVGLMPNGACVITLINSNPNLSPLSTGEIGFDVLIKEELPNALEALSVEGWAESLISLDFDDEISGDVEALFATLIIINTLRDLTNRLGIHVAPARTSRPDPRLN